MSSIDIETLLDLRRHLKIVHHVPGRIRLRAGPALYGHASALNGNGLQEFLKSVDGIHNIRVNSAVASLVIQYDPTRFPPELWETLISGSDENAAQLIRELIDEHEEHLTGAQL